MNKLYRVIYNRSNQTFQTVCEYARAQGRGSQTAVDSEGASDHVDSAQGAYGLLKFSLIMSGIILSNNAVAVTGATHPITNKSANYCYYDKTAQSVICGDENTSNLGLAGAIAVGRSAQAGHNSIAIGTEAGLGLSEKGTANGGTGGVHFVNGTTNVLQKIQATTISTDTNIAIGQNASKNATGQRNTAIGKNAGVQHYGEDSVAIGTNANNFAAAKNTNDSTLAVGDTYRARRTVAIGNEAMTYGEESIALGNGASTKQVSYANGTKYTTAENAIAVGENARAAGNSAIAQGANSAAQGNRDIVIGVDAKAEINPASASVRTNGIAIGYSAHVGHLTGDNAMAIGNNAKVIHAGNNKMAIGPDAISAGTITSAVGVKAIARGDTTSAYGSHTQTSAGFDSAAIGASSVTGLTGNNMAAIGSGAITNNKGATAIGSGNMSFGANSTVIGATGGGDAARMAHALADANMNDTKFSIVGGQRNTAIGNANLIGSTSHDNFVLGNQVKVGASKATVAKTTQTVTGADGNVDLVVYTPTFTNTKSVNRAVAIGQAASVADNDTIAIGTGAVAGGKNQPGSVGVNAIALGNKAQATKANTLAQGTSAVASGNHAIAIGNNAKAPYAGTVVIGGGAKVNAPGSGQRSMDNSVAIGRNATVFTGVGSIDNGANKPTLGGATAVGHDAETSYGGSVALGAAKAKAINSIAIGAQSGKHPDRPSYPYGFYGATTEADGSLALGNGAHVKNSASVGAQAIGRGAIAKGGGAQSYGQNTQVYGNSSIAIGGASQPTTGVDIPRGAAAQVGADGNMADNAIAIGISEVGGGAHYSISVGSHNTISGTHSSVVGNNNHVTSANTYVLGSGINTIGMGDQLTRLGDTVANSVYLGDDSTVTAGQGRVNNQGQGTLFNAKKDSNQVGATTTAGATGVVNNATVNGQLYGNFAGATAVGGVSVGASGSERRIQNVAAGEISSTSTDAINGSQLYMVTQGTLNQMPVVYTDAEGNRVYKQPNGTFSDANGDSIDPADVIASLNNGNGSTTAPTNLANVAGNLTPTYNVGDYRVAPDGTLDTQTPAFDATTHMEAPNNVANIYNNAATVGDVLNSGFNLQNNGEARDFVKAYDTVNFVDGTNTEAVVTTDADGKVSGVAYNLSKDITVDSITAGNTTINTNGITINNPGSNNVSLTNAGLNNGGNQITNVKAGTKGTDAVNLNQLNTVKNNLAKKMDSFAVGADTSGQAEGITINKDNARFDIVGAEDGQISTAVEGNKITVSAITSTITTNDDGVAAAATPAALATAGDIAKAINQSGFKLAAEGTEGSELIRAGETATFNAGDNLTVSREGGTITYKTKKYVTFNNVQLGDNGPKISSNEAGNITVANNQGNPVKIAGLAEGTDANDAVNVSQLTKAQNAATTKV
ncbi:ESPR-type extended signal peptide-containing protein, partial [Moraxella canis]|uniref:ESPR-type extended signal peptide-containing protein n=1 Tax=Moraxella canis TaxID=90239 RepID=UPI000669627C